MTRRPCPSCPWRVDQDASAIPHFQLELAEGLAGTCRSEVGEDIPPGQPMFACHQSRGPGEEVVCVGWLAVEGYGHIGVRVGVALEKWSPEVFRPGEDWPELHGSFREVIEKLRRTA